jgi:hypothetical protein
MRSIVHRVFSIRPIKKPRGTSNPHYLRIVAKATDSHSFRRYCNLPYYVRRELEASPAPRSHTAALITLISSQNKAVDMESRSQGLVRVARFPGLRALAWSGNVLYASRGYQVLRSHIQSRLQIPKWDAVGAFRPTWNRNLSVRTNLAARLFRDGFHALAILPSGGLVAVVPGAIVTLRPGETEFRVSHRITRGTRPLHITLAPGGAVFWGEYFDNASREEVHIYASHDEGASWTVAYTFPKGAIRHVHNIVHDPWENCFWILTGDYGDECRILRASCDLAKLYPVLTGNQQARAVAAVAMKDGLYFSTDTPLEQNFIYRLDRKGNLTQLATISSSSIYGCRVGQRLFFSTMIEPSKVNRDRHVRIYAGDARTPTTWESLLAWKKDIWPMGLFQYGNAFLPDGENTAQCLALTTVAVQQDEMVTSLYQLE